MGERKHRKCWVAPWSRPWTPNRLNSRKWAVACGYIGVVLGADLSGHPLQSHTLAYTEPVVLAILAFQSAIDYRRMKLNTDWQTGAATAAPETTVWR